MIKGYCRVSTVGQVQGNSLTDQREQILGQYPGAEVVSEAYSGAKKRAIFESTIESLNAGDTLVVTKLDRFCRSTKEGLEYIDYLLKKGVKIHILNMGLIENTPMGRLIVTQLLAFAEFERAMIAERCAAGKEIARQKPGYKEGRPRLEVSAEEIAEMKKDGMTAKEIYTKLGISKASYYNIIGGIGATWQEERQEPLAVKQAVITRGAERAEVVH